MSKKKLMIIAPVVLLLVVGVAYKMVLAPKPVVVKKKIEGHLLALDPEFVINLAGGRYAKLTVATLRFLARLRRCVLIRSISYSVSAVTAPGVSSLRAASWMITSSSRRSSSASICECA